MCTLRFATDAGRHSSCSALDNLVAMRALLSSAADVSGRARGGACAVRMSRTRTVARPGPLGTPAEAVFTGGGTLSRAEGAAARALAVYNEPASPRAAPHQRA